MQAHSNQNIQFWAHFLRGHQFPATYSDLLKVDGQAERFYYRLLGLPRGFLFNNFENVISSPKNEWMFSPGREIFDKKLQKCVPITTELLSDIPPTFTFAPRPVDAEQEVEFYVRSAGLPNHSFYWSDNVVNTGIDWKRYVQIRGDTNKEFRGRFTLTPLLPQIDGLGNYSRNGYYSMDQNDWDSLFLIKEN